VCAEVHADAQIVTPAHQTSQGASSATYIADPIDGDRFIDDLEAAEILKLSPSYLRQLRVKGGGCRYSRFGRAVRYRISDLFSMTKRQAALASP
jgi:hypothetical protein